MLNSLTHLVPDDPLTGKKLKADIGAAAERKGVIFCWCMLKVDVDVKIDTGTDAEGKSLMFCGLLLKADTGTNAEGKSQILEQMLLGKRSRCNRRMIFREEGFDFFCVMH